MKTYRTKVGVDAGAEFSLPLLDLPIDTRNLVSIVIQPDGYAHVTVRDPLTVRQSTMLGTEREVTRTERDASREGAMLAAVEDEDEPPRTR